MNKTVIYTAVFGEYDALLKPEFIPEGCDLVCFTDGDITSDVWKIVRVPLWNNDPTRSARRHKILPHRFLSDYEYSVWMDGNMLLRGDVNELINKYLKQANIAVYDHAHLAQGGRNCIYDEADILVQKAKKGNMKDKPEIMAKQIQGYKEEGYPKQNGLLSSMVILRRHNAPDVKQAMEDWWEEVKNKSKRDQLSFNYVAWKNNLNAVYIKDDSTNNPYFLRRKHSKSSVKKWSLGYITHRIKYIFKKG